MKRFSFGLLIGLLFSIFAVASASTPQVWMYLKQGANGLDFYCASEPIYQDTGQQSETEYATFALHPETLELFAAVVQTTSCNLDNLYVTDNGLFVWRFTSRVTDGHSEHRHMTRGAAWIRLLDFPELGN